MTQKNYVVIRGEQKIKNIGSVEKKYALDKVQGRLKRGC